MTARKGAPVTERGQRTARPKATVRHMAELLWETPPGHHGGAISKMLVRPENADTQLLDFRISCYQPMAHAEAHSHKRQEQIYHVLDGEGLMEIDGEQVVVRPNMTIFLPPGVHHAIHNSGTVDLIFLVITTPPSDS